MHSSTIVVSGFCIGTCAALAGDSDVQAIKGRVEIEHRADHFKASLFLANPTAADIEFPCGYGLNRKSVVPEFGCEGRSVYPAKFKNPDLRGHRPLMYTVPAGEEVLYDEYILPYPTNPGLPAGAYPLKVFMKLGNREGARLEMASSLTIPEGITDGLIRRVKEWRPVAGSDDSVSRELDDRYLSHGGKVESDNLRAAIQLLSFHARKSGYWQVILYEWRLWDRRSESRYVDVLGKMLAYDAAGRDIEALPPEKRENVASSPGVVLDENVLPELLVRARHADEVQPIEDHYVVAIARARDRRAVDFLAKVLSETQPHHSASTRFHAAVGLANLADPRGVEWLIDHVEGEPGKVIIAWPPGGLNCNLDACCMGALRHLSGNPKVSTKAEWREWWSTAREGFVPVAPVMLLDGP